MSAVAGMNLNPLQPMTVIPAALQSMQSMQTSMESMQSSMQDMEQSMRQHHANPTATTAANSGRSLPSSSPTYLTQVGT